MFQRWLTLSPDTSCLLLGPRRSGKTTFLRHRYPELRYTTLDDLDYLGWAKKDPKGFIQDLAASGIIDEIQGCPQLTVAGNTPLTALMPFS